jgi:ABC-type uncharacterized transport system substrate-binding protein
VPRLTKTVLIISIFLLMGTSFSHSENSASYKILVVMSYHETQPWENTIREGIESVLGGKGILKYVFLDTKYNPSQGVENARKAFSVYKEFRPDGVIAADDDAQSLFVVPYLKDKVKTPVMFCGVNTEAGKYGYPAENVSGILERFHIGESIALLQQLVPSVKTIGFIASDDSSGIIDKKLIEQEAKTYSAKSLPVKLVKSLDEAISAAKGLKKRCDALFLLSMASLKGAESHKQTDRHIFRTLSLHFGKPVISANDFEIRHGLLCAVVKSGWEQGATAAKMLLRAMNGTPVSGIPVTVNQEGKRMINVTTMKSLGIRPRPIILRGAELVHTVE